MSFFKTLSLFAQNYFVVDKAFTSLKLSGVFLGQLVCSFPMTAVLLRHKGYAQIGSSSKLIYIV